MALWVSWLAVHDMTNETALLYYEKFLVLMRSNVKLRPAALRMLSGETLGVHAGPGDCRKRSNRLWVIRCTRASGPRGLAP